MLWRLKQPRNPNHYDALKEQNAQLWAQCRSVGKERDDLRRMYDDLCKQCEKSTGRAAEPKPVYDADGLRVWSKNIGFLADRRFQAIYQRAYDSGHAFYCADGSPLHNIQWRVAVTCWAAVHGSKLEGDFVECGVNTGVHSLAICEYINFNVLGKKFYLFDTYCGMPEEQMSDFEHSIHKGRNERLYPECYEIAKKNFAPFPNAILVRGKIPDTLNSVPIEHIAYLSIDMNLAYPERCALEHFWPKMTPGAIVVLDDYAWANADEQKTSHDAFAASKGTEILTLPTGQGLLVRF
jgi:hypothetical protein